MKMTWLCQEAAVVAGARYAFRRCSPARRRTPIRCRGRSDSSCSWRRVLLFSGLDFSSLSSFSARSSNSSSLPFGKPACCHSSYDRRSICSCVGSLVLPLRAHGPAGAIWGRECGTVQGRGPRRPLDAMRRASFLNADTGRDLPIGKPPQRVLDERGPVGGELQPCFLVDREPRLLGVSLSLVCCRAVSLRCARTSIWDCPRRALCHCISKADGGPSTFCRLA